MTEANAEKIRERRRSYREANAEKIRERRRSFYEANAEKIREQVRSYREANAEKIRERRRSCFEANAEKIREQHRRFKTRNAEKIREQNRSYREANAEKIRDRAQRQRDAFVALGGSVARGRIIRLLTNVQKEISMVRAKYGIETPVNRSAEVATNRGLRPGGRELGTKTREEKESPKAVIVERVETHYETGVEDSEGLPLHKRLWIRGVDSPDDAQRFWDALGSDYATGKATAQDVLVYTNLLRNKMATWNMSYAQGRTFHLMPVPPTREAPKQLTVQGRGRPKPVAVASDAGKLP